MHQYPIIIIIIIIIKTATSTYPFHIKKKLCGLRNYMTKHEFPWGDNNKEQLNIHIPNGIKYIWIK